MPQKTKILAPHPLSSIHLSLLDDKDPNIFDINGTKHIIDDNGFIKQLNPKKFKYTKEYNKHQGTTEQMANLRIGYISSFLDFEVLSKMSVLEIGPGRGIFFEVMKDFVQTIDGFDVAESEYSTISLKKAHKQHWGLICGFDVIEHFLNIDDLFKFNFDYGYFTFPAPPFDLIEKEGKNGYHFRHYKPNEHIYYIFPEAFTNWVEKHGYEVISESEWEDHIRRRWNPYLRNISSFFIKKKFIKP